MTTTPTALTEMKPPTNKRLLLAVRGSSIEPNPLGIPTHGRISLAFAYRDADTNSQQVWDFEFDPGIDKPNPHTHACHYLRGSVYYNPENPLGKKPSYLWMLHWKTGDYPLTYFEVADMHATEERLEARTQSYQQVNGVPDTLAAYVGMICRIENIDFMQIPTEDGSLKLVTTTEGLRWLEAEIIALGKQLQDIRDRAIIDADMGL